MMDDVADGDMYGFEDEPYYETDDLGYGACRECGSFLYNAGAASEGDGDIGDELYCPLCQEQRGWFNRHWYDEDGNEIPEP